MKTIAIRAVGTLVICALGVAARAHAQLESEGLRGETRAEGPIEGAGEVIGPSCGVFLPCDKGEYCSVPPGDCGETGEPGICVEPSGECPEIFDPVCGCDGITYPNACVAHQNAMNVAFDGPCEGDDSAAARSVAVLR